MKSIILAVLVLVSNTAFANHPACVGLAEAQSAIKNGTEFKGYTVVDEFVRTPERAIEIWTPVCALQQKPPVRIGMSSKTVLEKTNMGIPSHVNRTTSAYGVREQWVYDDVYLYFQNGKLVAIQD